MRPLFALALILGCSSSAPGPDSPDAGAALDVAPDVVAADVGVDAGEDAGRPCVDRVRGVGLLCSGACDYDSCGTCGTVCPRSYSCCQGSPGRPDYCCISP